MNNERAVDQAIEHTDQYIKDQFAQAHQKIEEKKHREGCVCKSCLFMAVSEINLWLDFVDAPDYLSYEVVWDISNGLQVRGPR